MSVATVKTRLALIQGYIAGVKRAYADGPKTLPGPDLPCMVNFAGPSDMIRDGDGNWVERRTYYMRYYHAHIQTGLDNGEVEAARDAMITLIRDMFMARPGLGMGGLILAGAWQDTDGPLQGVMRSIWSGDMPAVLPYANENYIGIQCSLVVEEVVKVRRAAYE